MGFLSPENKFKAQMPGQQQPHVTKEAFFGSQEMADDVNKQIDEQNAANPGVTQTNFAPQIAAAQALNPSNVERLNAQPIDNSGQQALAQQLLAQARGQGPNPAQIALDQATNRNIQQGAGMIASQKGINPALQDRMIAQNAASAGQQAVGQGALMQAQQQLGAQNQLQGLYGQMGQQGLAQRQQDIGQNVQYNELMNQQRGMQNQYIGSLLGAQQGQNALNLQGSLGVQGINSGVAAQNQAAQNQLTGAALGAVGAVGAAKAGAAHGAAVGGQAPFPGDDERNDTVHAMLSPGEIVIPRSKAGDPEKAKEFVRALLEKGSKEGHNSKEKKGFGHVLQAKRKLDDIKKKTKN